MTELFRFLSALAAIFAASGEPRAWVVRKESRTADGDTWCIAVDAQVGAVRLD